MIGPYRWRGPYCQPWHHQSVPELPEVETVVRTLAPRLTGRQVRGVRFLSVLAFRGNRRRAATMLRGRQIEAVRRHGKFIVFELGGGPRMTIHLGMTGSLLWGGRPGPYTRAVFELDEGRLVFDDPRQFGSIEIGAALPDRLARLGPDAFEISAEEFAARLKDRRGRIKPLLLNQRFLRGLGNIYTDEALFRARIHPLAVAARLSRARVGRLHAAIQEVLGEAIASGGSSISDYVDAEGRRGWFQMQHRVYGKEGEPCPRCGAPIRRIVVAQRGTHYCPQCQRR
jgi:formamidopyrimidine-DNA glycosylase